MLAIGSLSLSLEGRHLDITFIYMRHSGGDQYIMRSLCSMERFSPCTTPGNPRTEKHNMCYPPWQRR